jgi:hypothetical protein
MVNVALLVRLEANPEKKMKLRTFLKAASRLSRKNRTQLRGLRSVLVNRPLGSSTHSRMSPDVRPTSPGELLRL